MQCHVTQPANTTWVTAMCCSHDNQSRQHWFGFLLKMQKHDWHRAASLKAISKKKLLM